MTRRSFGFGLLAGLLAWFAPKARASEYKKGDIFRRAESVFGGPMKFDFELGRTLIYVNLHGKNRLWMCENLEYYSHGAYDLDKQCTAPLFRLVNLTYRPDSEMEELAKQRNLKPLVVPGYYASDARVSHPVHGMCLAPVFPFNLINEYGAEKVQGDDGKTYWRANGNQVSILSGSTQGV